MASDSGAGAPRVLNINVGILGHVDSGKTSLARALSTLLSTAALDKHPQSAARGITLDLGFSAFQVDVPASLSHLPCDKLQFTLVDCPGHASLIRTIIGGAQIIDVMLLVVDVTRGFQTQTAECLVVGEISPCRRMLVALNKTDLLPPASRAVQMERMGKRVAATLRGTKFEGSSAVATSVVPGQPPEGVRALVDQLLRHVSDIERPKACGPLLFAVDHCFAIKGQGTVLTGTVLQGRMGVNDTVELPSLKLQRKVKSLQMFHRPVCSAAQGDRVGVCVAQLDPKLLERGLVAAPGSVPLVSAVVASVDRIRFHKNPVTSKTKYHVTVGHTTLMAEALFFRLPHSPSQGDSSSEFEPGREYLFCQELPERAPAKNTSSGSEPDLQETYSGPFWALLTFDSVLVCPADALLIGSRLDFDIHAPSCRLAFHGRVRFVVDPGPGNQQLKIFKMKKREGMIERVVDNFSVIGKGLFKKETDISMFVGLSIRAANGLVGTIQSSFGKSGKFKVVFKDQVPADLEDKSLVLEFKKFIFDKTKTIKQ